MNLFASLRQRRLRSRTLQSLSRLDDRILRDIGFERDAFGFGRDRLVRLQDLGR